MLTSLLRGRTRATCEPGTLCRDLKGDARPACCTDYSGAWDSRNLRELTLASARAGRRPSMLAFGNELVGEKAIEARLPAAQYAKELRELGAIAREAWPTSPPRRVAPDANFDDAWLRFAQRNLDAHARPPPDCSVAQRSSASRRAWRWRWWRCGRRDGW